MIRLRRFKTPASLARQTEVSATSYSETDSPFVRYRPKGERIKDLFMRHPLTILFGYIFVFLYGMRIYPFLNHPRKHYDCLLALVVHIVIGVTLSLFIGWQALLLTQLIPHFVACAMGSYLFYAQHNFPGVSFNDNAGWTYEKAALESSSFMRTNRIMAWFTGNIGYHHVHHFKRPHPVLPVA
jgi:acyl-lipid omega-6 desaturase (Delta-12 desaturase)